MSFPVFIVVMALTTRCMVHADGTLQVDPDNETEEQKALISTMINMNREYRAKEAVLTTDNQDECNKQKEEYMEAITKYLATKSDSESVTAIEVKNESMVLEVIRTTTCEASTGERAASDALTDYLYDSIKSAVDAGHDPIKAVTNALNSDQGKSVLETVQTLQAKIQGTPGVQNVINKGHSLQEQLVQELKDFAASSDKINQNVNNLASKILVLLPFQTQAKAETSTAEEPKAEEPKAEENANDKTE